MPRLPLVLTSILIGLTLSASSTHAAPIPSWRFDEEMITARPNEQIRISGTLFNDAAADSTFVIGFITPSGGGGTPPGNRRPLTDGYEISHISVNFVQPEFVAPGESFAFDWATLTPLPGLSPGIYGPGTASVNFGSGSGPIESGNLFAIHVVPEPATLALLGVGVVSLLGLRGRRGN